MIEVIVECMEYEEEMKLLIVKLEIIIEVDFVVGWFMGRIMRSRKREGRDNERKIVEEEL